MASVKAPIVDFVVGILTNTKQIKYQKLPQTEEIIMMTFSVSLQESLAIVYTPSSARVYTIYEPVIRLKGQAKTVVTQRPFSSKEVQSISLDANAFRSLLPVETHGLQTVLHKIGGTGNFVFLFAQVEHLIYIHANTQINNLMCFKLRILLLTIYHSCQKGFLGTFAAQEWNKFGFSTDGADY